jgi:hypothetical protein
MNASRRFVFPDLVLAEFGFGKKSPKSPRGEFGELVSIQPKVETVSRKWVSKAAEGVLICGIPRDSAKPRELLNPLLPGRRGMNRSGNCPAIRKSIRAELVAGIAATVYQSGLPVPNVGAGKDKTRSQKGTRKAPEAEACGIIGFRKDFGSPSSPVVGTILFPQVIPPSNCL